MSLEISNFYGHSTKNHLQLAYRLNPSITTIEPESIPSGVNFTITHLVTTLLKQTHLVVGLAQNLKLKQSGFQRRN